MSDPIVDADDLAVVLGDVTINRPRAEALIADAQVLCESVVSPLPATASVVVKRVAVRAYGSPPRQQQLAAAGSPFAPPPAPPGGVYLTDEDVVDLRRFAGTGGAFTIDTLPVGYVLPVSTVSADVFDDWDVP